jgi:maleylacetate reductase
MKPVESNRGKIASRTLAVVGGHSAQRGRSACPQVIGEGSPVGDSKASDFARSLGAPTSLMMLGMPEGGLDRAADLALADPYWNPRPVTRDALRALLESAYRGLRPAKIALQRK